MRKYFAVDKKKFENNESLLSRAYALTLRQFQGDIASGQVT